MTILTRPCMQTGNAHILPIDMKDPSLLLYLPLWYPHGDMTGSTIYSYDKNRRTCAVTGAVYGTYGRTFDGNDDYITLPGGIFQNNNFTLEVWVKSTATGVGQYLVAAEDDIYFVLYFAAATDKAAIYSEIGTVAKDIFSNADLCDSTFHHIVVTKSSTAGLKMYVDTVLQSDTDATATGNIDARNTASTIGITPVALTNDFTGTIGEALVHNKVFTQADVNISNEGKSWRYV